MSAILVPPGKYLAASSLHQGDWLRLPATVSELFVWVSALALDASAEIVLHIVETKEIN